MPTYQLDLTVTHGLPKSPCERLVLVYLHLPNGPKAAIDAAVTAMQITVAGTLSAADREHLGVKEVP